MSESSSICESFLLFSRMGFAHTENKHFFCGTRETSSYHSWIVVLQMLLRILRSVKMENYNKCTLSVVDVYDIAQDIGREFEAIIDAYGTDAITGLMPKVVAALEQMEMLAMNNERENTTVDDLRATVQQLEMDKQERTEDRTKYEKVWCITLSFT